MKPLIRKLKKCRDPDRVDLVALQRARKEQGMQKAKPKPTAKADGDVFGNSLSDKNHDAKRRRVVEDDHGSMQSTNDPFGGAL